MRTYPAALRGITLIELLIALAILAVTVTLAAPAFGSLVDRTNLRNARSELSVALGEARIAAVSRSAHVVVCPSRDQRVCSDGIEWQAGWIVFVDANRDRDRQAEETALSIGQARPAGTAIVSSLGRQRAAYRPDGSATGSNLTLTFCEHGARVEASTLVINNAGRVRSGAATPAQAAACAAVAG
jgi:type IV fimbrial biogenesis protein FimT